MSFERSTTATIDPPGVSRLVYSPAPGWTASEADIASAADSKSNLISSAGTAISGPSDSSIAAKDAEVWNLGFREGQAQARAESEAAVQQQRDGVAQALREFAQERDSYFHHVEGEVVALALAIVRKILRRESQVDPLLLSGLVRVALEKTSASKTARMRVNPSQVPLWKEYFSAHPDLPLTPEIEGDATLETNQCHLETEFGVTEVNIETQLKEIEKGLFDLLAQRPSPR